MLIHNISQLLTLSGPPQRGKDLGNLNIIPDGAVYIEDETVAAVGPGDEMLALYPEAQRLDAGGHVVMPGFVDPHTHLVWGGDRAAEFEMRLEGASYMEIMAAGGGIAATVSQTRAATKEQLTNQSLPRLREMFRHGTTTAEAKTGYGLDTDSELKMLQVILDLDAEGPLDLVPTFLGAHAVPPEYKSDPEAYTDLVCSEMLPQIREWWFTRFSGVDIPALPFVDVFCETGAFTLEQSRRILESAKSLDYPLKIHADEFDNLGGASLAADLGAVSADHLVVTSQKDINALGNSDTVAVSLPCTPFGLAEGDYTPAHKILAANGLFAIATDLNPGTALCGNMQFAVALACRYMKLTPAQAIAAATINAAAAIGMADRIGSLEPGKQADLVILDGPDYRHLGYRFGTNQVQTVIKKGMLFPLKG